VLVSPLLSRCFRFRVHFPLIVRPDCVPRLNFIWGVATRQKTTTTTTTELLGRARRGHILKGTFLIRQGTSRMQIIIATRWAVAIRMDHLAGTLFTAIMSAIRGSAGHKSSKE